ncbi:MAG: FAD-binding protein, partial [Vicinamibacteria bacterium]
HPLRSKAVVIATGGAGRIFPFTTNGAIKTGDGMAMAYRAGVPLKDMEFVQYHPTGLPGTGILMTEACRGEGGYLLNKDGERFLRNYVPNKMELGPRDILCRSIMDEFEAGRGIEGPYGLHVNLDLRHLGEKLIDEKLPFVRELATNYVGIDPVREPIPVRPVVHYMMGGIDTDADGATRLPGLFAAGEVACVSMNGANRLGSNSLTECLVFGRRAGEAAARLAVDWRMPERATTEKLAEKEGARIRDRYFPGASRKSTKGERIAGIRREMQAAMEAGAGVYRTEEELTKTCAKLAELSERARRVALDDPDPVFNTDLTAALELDFMLDLARAIAHAALARTESRGAHTRSDYRSRNDREFLKHSLAIRTEDGPKIEFTPATITRWQPEERKY